MFHKHYLMEPLNFSGEVANYIMTWLEVMLSQKKKKRITLYFTFSDYNLISKYILLLPVKLLKREIEINLATLKITY